MCPRIPTFALTITYPNPYLHHSPNTLCIGRVCSQAFRNGEAEVTLKTGKKTWRVDLTNPDRMKQYPVPQLPLQFKWRHVRLMRGTYLDAASTPVELVWEHRTARDKDWTEYPEEDCRMLTEVRTRTEGG